MADMLRATPPIRLDASTEVIGLVTVTNPSTSTGGGGSGSTAVSLDTSTAVIGYLGTSTREMGSFTLLNPSTAVTVTNISTAVTVTNPSTAVTVTNPSTQVNTLSSGPVLLGTSTAAIGLVTVSNPSTSVTVTNISTAVTVTNPSTQVNTLSSGPILLGTSTAAIGGVWTSTFGAVTPVYITSAAVSKISSSPGTLWWISAYTTSTGTFATGTVGVLRLHNTTTASSTGATVAFSIPIALMATSTGGTLAGAQQGDHLFDFGPRGMSFSSACSVDVTTNSTGTTALANAKITALYST